jgi:peptide/nickel transport system ATP-binding protein
MTSAPLLQVADLRIAFDTAGGRVRAVNGVSFVLGGGKTLAVVGESGSGKSVMSRSVMNMLPRHGVHRSGSVTFNGRDMFSLSGPSLQRVLGKEIGYVPQHPMVALNPVMTIGRQIGESLTVHLGMSRKHAEEESAALLASVGIPDARRRLGEYPHQMSGGMCQRIAIAIALSCRPLLIIADEPTTALDVTVQAQILDLLMVQQEQRGMALILVTHDLAVAANCTERMAVMYGGRLVEMAPTDRIFTEYEMRYTEALLRAIPRIDQPAGARLQAIAGQPPDPVRLPQGCPFNPRCPHVTERCRTEDPPIDTAGSDHWYACWNPVANGPRIEMAGG